MKSYNCFLFLYAYCAITIIEIFTSCIIVLIVVDYVGRFFRQLISTVKFIFFSSPYGYLGQLVPQSIFLLFLLYFYFVSIVLCGYK